MSPVDDPTLSPSKKTHSKEPMEVEAKGEPEKVEDEAPIGWKAPRAGLKFNPKLQAKREKKRLEKEEARLKVEESRKEEERIEKEKEKEEEKKGGRRSKNTIKGMFAKVKRKAEAASPGNTKKIKMENERCSICSQIIHPDFITMYVGPHDYAKDELTVLYTNQDLLIETSNIEDKPEVNISDYQVFDKVGHLVHINSGLLESGAEIKFDGVVRNLMNAGKGYHIKDCVMTSWWNSGFDGGENVLIGFSTPEANYYLKEPHPTYKPFMLDMWEQSFLVKYMIEFMEGEDEGDEGNDDENEDGIYERFLDYLSGMSPPRPEISEFTSESVIKHAEFLVSQILSYQQAGDADEMNYMDSPLIKRICELAGVQKASVKKSEKLVVERKKSQKPKFESAMVTPLVRLVFENLFKEQMAEEENPGKVVKAEVKPVKVTKKSSTIAQVKSKGKKENFKWIGKECKKAEIDGDIIVPGDNIMLDPGAENTEPFVGTVLYMYNDKETPMAHVRWFARGVDTFLGETGDPAELFLLDTCDDEPLLSYVGKASVEMIEMPDPTEWSKLGGSTPPIWERESDSSFFCSFWYNSELGRIEYSGDAGKDDVSGEECKICLLKKEKEKRFIPQTKTKSGSEITSVTWDQAELKVGDTVYLSPGSAKMKTKPVKLEKETLKKENVDEDLYPEYYRKTDHVKGNNFNTPDPFIVARILKFKGEGKEVKLKVGLFYRPESIVKSQDKEEDNNMFLLYWSKDTDWVAGSDIEGRCFLRCGEDEYEEATAWCEQGPDRWVFRHMFDSGAKTVDSLPAEAKEFGSVPADHLIPSYPQVKKKLRSLDIFAGCGGLSQGLHDAGVADTRWAVEVFEPAAKAFKLNNKDCTVFTDDCNKLLRCVMEGKTTNEFNQKYPQRGEVDLLCGGPPCQGFSGMNRFNAGEYSLFKNSLVSSYLSYAEYYRPKFFILENVKNFANFKKSMVLKSCLRALVKMGYQCTFGIMQAGQFGIAQTRRRAIILAAAPGQVLPRYPEPEHVFSPQACHLSVEVDGRRFNSQTRWVKSAPRKTVTVWDTMSDLPKINNGESKEVMKYGGNPKSHFQKHIRNNGDKLYDHITKKLAPLIVKRFEYIPTTPGSDWRDLPNKVVELSDGKMSKKLHYFYEDKKNGKSSTGSLRGVCACMAGEKCDPKDNQQNTLIPWCLPHTANRHNNWAGLYGRVEWDGFFSTTITNPEPMGKQGRVLHPDQNRLVSVRECARSQGFPDTYRFYGSVLEKHRQIGNAVPPPLGRALGVSILHSLDRSKQQ